jgi:hypothetical protein
MITQATILNTATTILTVPGAQNYLLHSITFCNIHAATTETLTVYLVPQGSSAGDSTTILKSFDILAKRTLTFREPYHLGNGDKLIAIGSTGSLITATANYTAEG